MFARGGKSQALAVFIDSGSDVSIIDEELAQQLRIQQVRLPQPVPANALDGHLLGTVTHQTTLVHMLISLLGPTQTGGFVEEEGEASSVEEDEDFQEREAERASSDEY
ncbi:hypothetical protein NQZ68_005592 [Dissostichus eleginoides]|nr:hypothetical protein NQZ68_005592 [Dissostichus eleginoides]